MSSISQQSIHHVLTSSMAQTDIEEDMYSDDDLPEFTPMEWYALVMVVLTTPVLM